MEELTARKTKNNNHVWWDFVCGYGFILEKRSIWRNGYAILIDFAGMYNELSFLSLV